MSSRRDRDTLSAIDPRIVPDDACLESNRGATPVIDEHDALEAFLAFDDGALAAVPHALDAYVRHQLQHIY